MNKKLFAYGCGSPIRIPITQALAAGSNADGFIPNSSPIYQGGDSIIWGLIRGAHEIMMQTRKAKNDFFQIDNAYFGRNIYFRVTLNALQLNYLPKSVIDNRYKDILKKLGKQIKPWKKERNGPIVICPSSNFLYQYMGTTLEDWIKSVIIETRKNTARPIIIRYKELMPKDNIDDEIKDAWLVVTHVSAAALDALRLGIPVITTAPCAASSLTSSFINIESPNQGEGRDELFSLLANGQFTQDEMKNERVLETIIKLSAEFSTSKSEALYIDEN
jgi:hypothetical protein